MGGNPEEVASVSNDAQKNGSESNDWMVIKGKQTQKRKLSAWTDDAYRNIEQSQELYPKSSPTDETKVMSRKGIHWKFIAILLERMAWFAILMVCWLCRTVNI